LNGTESDGIVFDDQRQETGDLKTWQERGGTTFQRCAWARLKFCLMCKIISFVYIGLESGEERGKQGVGQGGR